MRNGFVLVVSIGILGCSSDDAPGGAAASSSSSSSGTVTLPDGGTAPIDPGPAPPTTSMPGVTLPIPGNPDGKCVDPGAALEDVSTPATRIGDGTPGSCTGDAFIAAVAKGGVITFNCGADPVKITLSKPAKVFNKSGPKVVIDGGNKVTLSGGGKTRILYMNSCAAELEPTGPKCNEAEAPVLTVQNLVFADGDTKALSDEDNAGGGGAIWVRGNRTKILKSRFVNNACADLGPDVAGGAVRVLDFPDVGSVKRPVYIEGSTFENNHCANGGAVGSIGTSYTVLNSVFTGNKAVGNGASSGNGGNGGAIYNDGNTYDLNVCGTRIEGNNANAGGSAIFYVSNNKTGTLSIKDSIIKNNPKGENGFQTAGFPGFFIIAKASPTVSGSTIEQ